MTLFGHFCHLLVIGRIFRSNLKKLRGQSKTMLNLITEQANPFDILFGRSGNPREPIQSIFIKNIQGPMCCDARGEVRELSQCHHTCDDAQLLLEMVSCCWKTALALAKNQNESHETLLGPIDAYSHSTRWRSRCGEIWPMHPLPSKQFHKKEEWFHQKGSGSSLGFTRFNTTRRIRTIFLIDLAMGHPSLTMANTSKHRVSCFSDFVCCT